ncbi:MAG: PsiF family protein [Burkholderiaceae bacterium]
MTKLLSLIAVGVVLSFGTAYAQDKPKTEQQSKMVICNKDAGDKKGDERKAFMKTCLSAKKVTQQSKMTTCNKDAGEKKGDERKKFMSECLKKAA